MADTIGAIMEQASRALVRMDYLACEELCLRALALARQAQDWPTYGRVLLPLQESRRHRRMIAAEGAVRLGTSQLLDRAVRNSNSESGAASAATSILQSLHPPVVTLPLAACVVVTRPHLPETAAALIQFAREQHHFIEVLYADNNSAADQWVLRSISEPVVNWVIPAPPAPWREQWLLPATQTAETSSSAGSPADWFIDATEALGNAALQSIMAPPATLERLKALEACLRVVTDHELIHQRLGDAAGELAKK